MATYYVDLESGNDANAGTSFATRWKTLTSGATAARIAPGDEIRVMASTDQTTVGLGTWSGKRLDSTARSYSSTNATPVVVTVTNHGFSTGDVVYIGSGSALLLGHWAITVTGTNTFTLNGSTAPGGTSSGNLYLRTSSAVGLTTAVTVNLAATGKRGSSSFTAIAPNIASANNNTKNDGYSDLIQFSPSFGTGRAFYRTLPSTLNLSGYRQISFWIYISGGVTITSTGQIDIRLCSDTLGSTAVNTFQIPQFTVTGSWRCVTLDNGSALGSSIASIGIYRNSLSGNTQNMYISNLIACKSPSDADSLTLNSLISTGNDNWYPIQSIDSTNNLIILDRYVQSPISVTNIPAYSPLDGNESSQYIQFYKREPIVQYLSSSSLTINDNGTAGSPIRFSGGWNRTDMSTKTGETWVNYTDALYNGLTLSSRSFIEIEDIHLSRAFYGLSISGTSCRDIVIKSYKSAGCQYGIYNNASVTGAATTNTYAVGILTSKNTSSVYGVYANQGSHFYAEDLQFTSCDYGIQISNFSLVEIKQLVTNSNRVYGYYQTTSKNVVIGISTGIKNNTNFSFLTSSDTNIGILTSYRSITYGIENVTNGNIHINSGISTGNPVTVFSNNIGDLYLKDFTITNDTSTATFGTVVGNTVYAGNRVLFHNYGKTANDHRIISNGATIQTDSSVTATGSGISWEFSPTNIVRDDKYPVTQSLAKVAVAANSQVSVAASVRRDSTTINLGIYISGSDLSQQTNPPSFVGKRPGNLAGIATVGIASTATGSINTWERLSFDFTPTESGVFELFGFAYGGSTFNGWIDNLEISQI